MYVVSSVLILSLSSLLVLFKGEDYKTKFSGYQSANFELPFAIATPDNTYKLSKKLNEISGLKFLKEDHFLAVNDENPKLFTYNLSKNKIIDEIDFGKRNDYEGLTIHKNLAYVAVSNGDIKVVDWQLGKKVEEYKTPLSSRNNVEGLCYDAPNHQLIMACKGELEKTKNNHGKKGFYAFNLTTKLLDKTPYKLIDLKAERKTLRPLNLIKNFANKLKVNARLKAFAPSGLDIDPITKDLYIIANRGKILLVLDKNKVTKGIYFLPKRLYPQPEGLSFDEQGNLYISNEGRSEKATILKFCRAEKS